MDVEQKMVSFPMDEQLQTHVQALVAEGWQLNPSAPPVAVYHLVRAKKPEPQQVQPHEIGKLIINDELIHIVKAQP